MKNNLHTNSVQLNNYNIRMASFEGREHIVVPVVMMAEGVHSGSHGPILHLGAEIGRFPGAWDGIPVTVGHPMHEQGFGVSAKQ
jgi:hypothetical protein